MYQKTLDKDLSNPVNFAICLIFSISIDVRVHTSKIWHDPTVSVFQLGRFISVYITYQLINFRIMVRWAIIFEISRKWCSNTKRNRPLIHKNVCVAANLWKISFSILFGSGQVGPQIKWISVGLKLMNKILIQMLLNKHTLSHFETHYFCTQVRSILSAFFEVYF